MEKHNNSLKLYSISRAAKLMGISRHLVRSFITNGDIGYIEIGKRRKIPNEEILRFQKEKTIRKREPEKREMSSDEVYEFFTSTSKTRKDSFDSKILLQNILRGDKDGNS